MDFTTGKVQQKKYRDQKRRMSIRKKKAGKTNKQTNKTPNLDKSYQCLKESLPRCDINTREVNFLLAVLHILHQLPSLCLK